jgi:hypothetical protein
VNWKGRGKAQAHEYFPAEGERAQKPDAGRARPHVGRDVIEAGK